MFDIVYEYITTVPVASPLLRSFLMLIEILLLGVLLYCVWEYIPLLVSRIYGRAHALIGRRRAVARNAAELDEAYFVDIAAE